VKGVMANEPASYGSEPAQDITGDETLDFVWNANS
jgi:hypothetical protein